MCKRREIRGDCKWFWILRIVELVSLYNKKDILRQSDEEYLFAF